MTTEEAPAAGWRNRIVGTGTEDPQHLLANPRNWRIHPRKQQAALAGALDTVGWVQQVMVNQRTGYVVDGHARVAVAIARHEREVPVIYVDLSPEEEALVLATLDPMSALAGTDDAKLAELLGGISVDDAGLVRLLDGLGRKPQHVIDPDAIPDPGPEIYVQPGDLWQLGRHRIVCGDATDPAVVARLLAGERPRLLNTDPPYGVSLDPTWRDSLYPRFGPGEKPYMQEHVRIEGHTNVTLSGDTRIDWSDAYELVPSLEVGYVWHAGVHAAEVAAGLLRVGFEIVSQVIWDKGIFAMGRSWYHWAHEPCWAVRKPGVPNLWFGERDQGTIWRVPSPKMLMGGSKEEKFDHPAQKPVVLCEIPIRNHTEAGESVYDPFLGSGTTLIAAEGLDRRCYGAEIEPRYAQIVIERWQAYAGARAVRVNG